MTITAGKTLGHYEIRSLIGKGGMGEVYLAEDSELERCVAIKILSSSVLNDRERLQRFVKEAKAASALNHPNILTIHEIGEFEHARFIVMEYIDGETLKKHMDRNRMNLLEVLDVSIQVASALSAAHEAGIVHRDIKPQNIMIRRDQNVKVVDFGLAKLMEPQALVIDTEAPTRSYIDNKGGAVMGTPYYMSPEQACGREVDARADLWSLGVIIYEMVAGHLPFEGDSPNSVIARVLERDPVSLSKCVPGVPAGLEWIVAKTLSKNRDGRYQTAKDLLIDLKRLRKKLDISAEFKRTDLPDLKVATSDPIRSRQQLSKNDDGPATLGDEMRVTGTLSRARSVTEFRHYKWLALVNLGLLLATLAAIAYVYDFRQEVAISVETIAVLPFENAGTDPDSEYLADGMSESLINSLAHFDQLRVVARNTAFRYKGREIDPAQVGRELKVRIIMTGRVRQTGDDLNIQVDLVDAATGTQLWGEEYQRKVADLMSVKQDIVREITEKLRMRLTGEEQQRLEKRDPTDAETYKLYLKGRFYWNRRNAESLKKAIDHFNRAIETDPNYALAYVGLADSYVLSSAFNYGDSPATEVYPKAQAAIERALAIDDSLAEAHATSALIQSHYRWNWPAAEAEFKRAIELNRGYATAHHWYARHLMAMGRFEEAETELSLAQELDPLSPIIASTMGDPFYYRRRYDEVIEHNKKALELDPNFRRAHFYLMLAYQATGRFENAIVEREFLGATPAEAAAMRKSFARYGKRGYWQELTGIVARDTRHVSTLDDRDEILLRCYIEIDDREHAFEILERMFQQRFEGLIYLKVDPVFDRLRSDPRFADLLGRIGLSP
jgi:eukaryotic-like serine/threonine-protein kinase